MGGALIAFAIGMMIGLLGRPVLDAYVYWRTATSFVTERPKATHATSRD